MVEAWARLGAAVRELAAVVEREVWNLRWRVGYRVGGFTSARRSGRR